TCYTKSNITKYISPKLFYPHELQHEGEISILSLYVISLSLFYYLTLLYFQILHIIIPENPQIHRLIKRPAVRYVQAVPVRYFWVYMILTQPYLSSNKYSGYIKKNFGLMHNTRE
ncbi:hypothetical protein ACJX0J_020414, partial [Zea mays]